MNAKQLREFLTDDVTTLELEDTNGNTVLFVDLNNIEVADTELNGDKTILRLQEVEADYAHCKTCDRVINLDIHPFFTDGNDTYCVYHELNSVGVK